MLRISREDENKSNKNKKEEAIMQRGKFDTDSVTRRLRRVGNINLK